MRLRPDARDQILEDFARRLDFGSLVFYEAGALSDPLVTVPFQSPAFLPVEDGRLVAQDLPPTKIEHSGDASRAELVTADGTPIADVAVRRRRPEDETDSRRDILVDTTDFQRGFILQLTDVTLTLPLQA